MTTETKIRNRILKRIERISSEQLSELDEYLKKLEKQAKKKKKVLSYAGVWKDIDENIFREFTEELVVRRQENKRRSNEKSAD